MDIFKIIKKPVITEKTQRLELAGVYTVEINSLATKVDVKNAFKSLYSVEVADVNISKVREKFRNTRKWTAYKRKPFTKAIVTLKNGQRLNDFMKLKIKD